VMRTGRSILSQPNIFAVFINRPNPALAKSNAVKVAICGVRSPNIRICPISKYIRTSKNKTQYKKTPQKKDSSTRL